MSRAFVKEQDNVPPDDPPEFEVSAGPNLVTSAGLERITAKVAEIEAQLAANPDADARVLLMRDFRYWIARKNSARVFVPSNPGEVEFGSQVTIERGGRRQTFVLVGEDEAEPGAGRINWRSPLADAILGARVGDIVEMGDRAPPDEIRILEIISPAP
jgi:transcription elongation GreA/GreB family factor